MSNLNKNVYFTVDEEDKRVINSDDYGKEVHPEIYHGKEVESEIKPFSFRQLGDETAASLENMDEQPEDFQEGMNVLSMEEVREEEKKIISEELNDEREKILQEARKEAEKIIDSANLSADDIKNQAFEEGKQSGLEEGRNQGLMEIEEQKEKLEEDYNLKMAEVDNMAKSLEPKYADIVAGLVEKITGVVCRDKKDIIVYLIDNALHGNLQGAEKTKNITLHISKADMGIVTAKKDDLVKGLNKDIEVDIIEDTSLEHNQCVIDFDTKVIDCSLDTQLKSLRDSLRMIAM